MDSLLYTTSTGILRDIHREVSRVSITSTSQGIYIYYLLVFILSESIVFTTILWVYFHVILSGYYTIGYECILVPEPYELTYSTTLLLSNAGTSTGMVYTGRVQVGIYYWNTLSSLYHAIVFLLIQYWEFSILGVYTNDTYTGTVYTSISVLHPIHVSLGTVLVLVCISSDSQGIPYYSNTSTSIGVDMYSSIDYSY